jgi:hydrogenase nickel incorporation protein HypB
MTPTTRLVEVRQKVLKSNDLVARALRARFQEAGVYVVSLVSSPGAGKTLFLAKVLGILREHYRVAALEGWDVAELDFLFIENVGNLVCPATFDLGEDLRLVLLSVTEGEDKPLKYPTIFNTADAALITKMDLAAAVEFDAVAAHRNIESVRPGMPVFEVSAKTGEGLEQWLRSLQARLTTVHRDSAPSGVRSDHSMPSTTAAD